MNDVCISGKAGSPVWLMCHALLSLMQTLAMLRPSIQTSTYMIICEVADRMELFNGCVERSHSWSLGSEHVLSDWTQKTDWKSFEMHLKREVTTEVMMTSCRIWMNPRKRELYEMKAPKFTYTEDISRINLLGVRSS